MDWLDLIAALVAAARDAPSSAAADYWLLAVALAGLVACAARALWRITQEVD